MKRKANNSHLTLTDRKIIEEKLNEGVNVNKIAKEMCRNRSTIKREIERHIKLVFPSIFNNYHPCIKSDTCTVKEINCYEFCKNIEFNLCPKLNSETHVCNSCTTKRNCRNVRKYYNANEANSEYLKSWTEDRIGIRYTEEELLILNNDFYNLVITNKSIYHSLIVINKRGFDFKERTIYYQIKKGCLRLKYADLPRNRKSKSLPKDTEYKNKESIEGHMYDDYESYKDKNENAIETQMDTVIGITNATDPVILTLEIVKISFMFIFKLNRKTFEETLKKLQEFEGNITTEIFSKIMEILLTDNGSEFKSVSKIIEVFPDINIFYCHPYSSYEKGSIENNHELLRRVIPKGISLKPYSQTDYNKLASHINSLYRKKLKGKCPFELIEEYIPIEIINKLGLAKVDDTKVNLTPYLLGTKNVENIKKYLTYEEMKEQNISLKRIEQEDNNE